MDKRIENRGVPNRLSSKRQRITFATSKTLAYVSVLELTSIFERSLRRAGIPVLYSQGFNPRPRMNFAAPLPVGCGAQADLLDVWLEHDTESPNIYTALENKVPKDMHILDVTPVDPNEPTLAERLESAEYIVWVDGLTKKEITSRIKEILAKEIILRPRRGKKYRGQTYDIRPLILDLASKSEATHASHVIWMHLRARPGATGRPDEVLKAMDISDSLRRCYRQQLHLATNAIT